MAQDAALAIEAVVNLSNKLRELENRCEAMEQAEVQMRQKNEAECQQFKREKQILEELSRKAELHAAMQCKQHDEQIKIMKKHEGENKAMEMAFQDQKKKLVERQQLELQKLEIEESNETDKERIAELEEEQQMLQDTVNALAQKERTATDHLEDARKVAVQVLDTYGSNKIGNKLMGTIDKGPWKAVCKEKFKYHPDGWEVMMTRIISEWETRIRNHEYHPYKMLKLDEQGDKMKRIINEDDEVIKKLKEDLGAEVLQTVETAFFEIEEYNASGRYPVHVAWNFQKKERVQLKDLLLYLKDLLHAAGKQGKAEKKRVRAY